MKKEERHQIKRDGLVTAVDRAEFYFEHHVRRVVLIVLAAGLLVVAGFGLRGWLSARGAKASFAMSEIIQTFRAPVASSPEALQQIQPGSKSFATSEERDRKVIELADGVLTGSGMGAATPTALYYKALALEGLVQRDEATRALERLLKAYPHVFLAAMARYKLAQIKESEKNPSEALVHFQALYDDAKVAFPKEEALMGIARCQESLGRKDEARETYRKIVSDYPDSDYQPEARRKVDELS
jgi:TolA-binding protein